MITLPETGPELLYTYIVRCVQERGNIIFHFLQNLYEAHFIRRFVYRMRPLRREGRLYGTVTRTYIDME